MATIQLCTAVGAAVCLAASATSPAGVAPSEFGTLNPAPVAACGGVAEACGAWGAECCTAAAAAVSAECCGGGVAALAASLAGGATSRGLPPAAADAGAFLPGTLAVAAPLGCGVLSSSCAVDDAGTTELVVLGARDLVVAAGEAYADPGAYAVDVATGEEREVAVLGLPFLDTTAAGTTFVVGYVVLGDDGRRVDAADTRVVTVRTAVVDEEVEEADGTCATELEDACRPRRAIGGLSVGLRAAGCCAAVRRLARQGCFCRAESGAVVAGQEIADALPEFAGFAVIGCGLQARRGSVARCAGAADAPDGARQGDTSSPVLSSFTDMRDVPPRCRGRLVQLAKRCDGDRPADTRQCCSAAESLDERKCFCEPEVAGALGEDVLSAVADFTPLGCGFTIRQVGCASAPAPAPAPAPVQPDDSRGGMNDRDTPVEDLDEVAHCISGADKAASTCSALLSRVDDELEAGELTRARAMEALVECCDALRTSVHEAECFCPGTAELDIADPRFVATYTLVASQVCGLPSPCEAP